MLTYSLLFVCLFICLFLDVISYTQRGGTRITKLGSVLTGKGSFAVDETFVKANLVGLTDDDRSVMDAFVGQSLGLSEEDDKEEEEEEEEITTELFVKKGLFRIADSIPRDGDRSVLRDSVFSPTEAEDEEFDFEGRLIATDGGRSTKLTKIFRRRDNQGKLMDAIHRMKLDQ